MTPDSGKVVIIGGGIAGLCSAVYARRCGYSAELLEMQATLGGLAANWRRGDYTFENCLHWLMGVNPARGMYGRWQEVLDMRRLTLRYQDEFAHLEDEHGRSLPIYNDVDRMESELLRSAPEDAAEIHRFAAAVRQFAQFPMPFDGEPWPRNLLMLLRLGRFLPALRHWSGMTLAEYGERFRNPLLRAFFADSGELSALVLVFAMGWLSSRDAAYVIGGSQAIIRGLAANLESLGGRIRLGAKAQKILVEGDAAVGVQLESGESIPAKWVISAADGHATIFDMLSGRYSNDKIETIYSALKPFPSYVQVNLGVRRSLDGQPAYLTRILEAPLAVDPETRLSRIPFRFFHFDPSFAPEGKTAVTCNLSTRNYSYWAGLKAHDPSLYESEKQRVAKSVRAVLEDIIPGIGRDIEVTDVCTPATVIRYTGNWQGSMEGWLIRPGESLNPLPNTLPGLRQLVMAGQWVMPGGGLPSGLITGRSAVQLMCKQDGVPFLQPRGAAAAA